ncbi:MAG TPA: 4'-phosphopantetheinyl transferase superfamily protein [Bryobacteraceae bacterium]|jgi:4'-phosphopantetheinyl transferase
MLPLPDDEVHVWLIALPNDGRVPESLEVHLSPEESGRAARFVFDRDRARYVVAHTALRDILSAYTGDSPTAVALLAAEHGKPHLADHPDIRFNLSHSSSWAMAAVSLGREVGVDIEWMRPERPTVDIAQRFFAPGEVSELMKIPEEGRAAAFFACWSRKEAYIKARGEGLRIGLDSFEVSLDEVAVLRKAPDLERWSLCALAAPSGYAAALMAEGSGWRVKQRQWSGLPKT